MAGPYTRERLAEAAAGAATLTEAIAALGADPRSPTRRYLRERMRALGIDTAHFTPENRRWSPEALAGAVAASQNMGEVLDRLGVPRVGGRHTHLSRRIRELGIDTSHFTGQARGGSAATRRTGPAILVRQDPGARRVPGARLRRAMLRAGIEDRCSGCGIPPAWRGQPLPLEVDHRDGDRNNNRPENLRLLCPNCHAATDTYRGRGKRTR
ncbi:HNH endonuclease [Streptomyces sp. XM4011]|uniref:HNH endonuclease signature motif containing protein n=1 Tax=Streptomyces sp. XM4011 TaxID=2929780 RepID=UPI001FF9371F|nr:HNH endonuclease signature motif containing protein [Streptomyces sp. XM4011]MCK1817347.1 HNH endonuclease [Streptomyces sp. XM4011]